MTEYRVRSTNHPAYAAYGPTKRLDLAINVKRSRQAAYPKMGPWVIESREFTDWEPLTA